MVVFEVKRLVGPVDAMEGVGLFTMVMGFGVYMEDGTGWGWRRTNINGNEKSKNGSVFV
jgi:hypothetical protein